MRNRQKSVCTTLNVCEKTDFEFKSVMTEQQEGIIKIITIAIIIITIKTTQWQPQPLTVTAHLYSTVRPMTLAYCN